MLRQINPEYVDYLISWVNTSPFPRHLAMRLHSLEIGQAEISLSVGPEHFQLFELVHGGVMATLIDTATFWSVYLHLPEDAGLVNIDLRLNYLQPVTQGPLMCRGRCIRSGNTLSYAEASVYAPHEQLCAHGTSTLMTLPGKGPRLPHTKYLNA